MAGSPGVGYTRLSGVGCAKGVSLCMGPAETEMPRFILVLLKQVGQEGGQLPSRCGPVCVGGWSEEWSAHEFQTRVEESESESDRERARERERKKERARATYGGGRVWARE